MESVGLKGIGERRCKWLSTETLTLPLFALTATKVELLI